MKKISTFLLGIISLYAVKAQTVPPYTQDFSTFPPMGWTLGFTYSPSVGTGPTYTDTNKWFQAPFLKDTEHNDPSIRIDLYTSNISHWAITNTFDLSGTDKYKVSFDIGSGSGPYYATGPAPQIECDDTFKFLISSDGGTTWTELKSITSPNINIPNAATLLSFDLDGYNSANTKFALYASDGKVFNWQANYSLYIDNFKVEKKTDLAVSETSNKSVKLYPNPTSGKVFLQSKKEIKAVEIYNIPGQIVYKGKEVDLTKYPAGTYYTKITFVDNTTQTEKIIKK